MNTNASSDILMSYDTDIDFEFGDLMLATGSDFLKRKVFKLLLTEVNDWKKTPDLGANPSLFIGEKNSRNTAQKIQNFITERIQPYILPVLINVRVIPIDYDSVKCYIDLLYNGELVSTIPFTMDFINGFHFTELDERTDKIVSSNNHKINTPENIPFANPIKDIISRQ